MIGLLMMLMAYASPPIPDSKYVVKEKLFCALVRFNVRGNAILELEDSSTLNEIRSSAWKIKIGKYEQTAQNLNEPRPNNVYINHLQWPDENGNVVFAKLSWSNSWGSTGTAATIVLARKDGSHSLSGRCYFDPKLADEDVGE